MKSPSTGGSPKHRYGPNAEEAAPQQPTPSHAGVKALGCTTLQQALHVIHQNCLFNELLSGVAHRINQPLSAITTYAEVSQRQAKQLSQRHDQLAETLEKISRQAYRAAEVMNELRGLGPGGLRLSDEFAMGALIDELRHMAAEEARASACKLVWWCESDLPSVKVDAIQIQHVLLLLLRNSFESFLPAVPRSREVAVAVSATTAHEVQVAVEDNGRGISEEQRATLYHPFTSTKQNRLGMSLAICNTIIVNHGGRIWYEHGSEGGSRIVFTLPTATTRE